MTFNVKWKSKIGKLGKKKLKEALNGKLETSYMNGLTAIPHL